MIASSASSADVCAKEVLRRLRRRNVREFGQFRHIIRDYRALMKRTGILQNQVETLKKDIILKGASSDGSLPTTAGPDRQRDAARAHLNALEKRVLELQTDLARAYKKDAASAQQRLDLTQKNEELRQSVTDASERLKMSQGLLSKCRASISGVKGELAAKSRECLTLRTELKKVRQLMETSEHNVRELTVANESLVEQMIKSKSAMGIEMNKITSILESKGRIIAKLEAEVRMLRSKEGTKKDGRRRSSSGGGFWAGLTKSRSGSSSESNDARAAREMMNRTSGWNRSSSVACPSESVHFFQAHKSEINDIAFCASDGREVCVTASSDSTVKIWDARSGQGLGTLRADSPILSVAARNGVVVGGTTESQAIVWTTRTLRTRHKITGHRGKVVSVDFSSDARKIVTAAADRTVKVWDMSRSASCLATLHCPSECTSAVFTLDGSLVVSSHKDSGIRLWDLRSKSLQREIKNIHRACITSLSVAPGGTGAARILTMSRDNSITLIDGRSFMEISRFRDIKFRVGTIHSRACFSPRAGYVAAGSGNGAVFVWDTGNVDGAPQKLDGHTACVKACAWGRRFLGTGDSSGYLALWA